ncbi:MAG: hypothetical protein IH920_00915 [Chloroflexi bacterium]|nr:hypothetical protein [Chloroflexota bacterium]
MSSKLERDIEEVLAQIDRFPPKRSLWSRIRRRVANAVGGVGEAISSIPWPRIGIGQVLLIAIAVIVIAYYGFRNSNIGSILIFGGILAFIGAFIFSLRRQSASRLPEKRWRGQPMDLDEPGGSWWKRWRSRR